MPKKKKLSVIIFDAKLTANLPYTDALYILYIPFHAVATSTLAMWINGCSLGFELGFEKWLGFAKHHWFIVLKNKLSVSNWQSMRYPLPLPLPSFIIFILHSTSRVVVVIICMNGCCVV